MQLLIEFIIPYLFFFFLLLTERYTSWVMLEHLSIIAQWLHLIFSIVFQKELFNAEEQQYRPPTNTL